jgi:NAD(P)-dependent dehydrogenase (short-subunit alcohol dehydrogenase family)
MIIESGLPPQFKSVVACRPPGISRSPFDRPASPVAKADVTVFDALFTTKLRGQYLIAKYAAPRLAERGSLVLTSGVLSIRPGRVGRRSLSERRC